MTNSFNTERISFNNIGLNGNLTLYSGGRINNAIKQGKIDVDASQADAEAAFNTLALNCPVSRQLESVPFCVIVCLQSKHGSLTDGLDQRAWAVFFCDNPAPHAWTRGSGRAGSLLRKGKLYWGTLNDQIEEA